MPPRPRRTAPAGAAPAPRSRFAAALREMAEQEVGVQGRKVEAARRLVHELHTVGVRAIHELIFDPRHRLLDRGFACAHRDPPMKGAPAAARPPIPRYACPRLDAVFHSSSRSSAAKSVHYQSRGGFIGPGRSTMPIGS